MGVSGSGDYVQTGGTAVVNGRLKLGRYDKPTAVGTMTLGGGSVRCERFEMNSHSFLHLNGGVLIINGDASNTLQSMVAAGQILGDSDVSIIYDIEQDQTRVYSKTYQMLSNFVGVNSAWSDPSDWRPQKGRRMRIHAIFFGFSHCLHFQLLSFHFFHTL